MTAAQLIAQVKIDIDQQGDAGRFSDTELLSLLNEGYVDFCRFTECREKKADTLTAALEAFYSLPSDFLDARQFRWADTDQLITKHERRLDDDERDWVFDVGTPENVVYFNWNVVRIKPIPASAGTVQFRYAYITSDMIITDSPDYPHVWHDALVDFVNAQCFFAMREYENGAQSWLRYVKRREKAKAQSRLGQRTPDTFVTRRPISIFNYRKWDQGYRTR